MGSQILKQQALNLHLSAPGLCVYVMGVWCFCETPNRGSGCFSDSYSCFLDIFLTIDLPVQNYRKVFILSYQVLLCPLWLFSLGGLLFLEEKMDEEWIYGRGDFGKSYLKEWRKEKLWFWWIILEKNLFSINIKQTNNNSTKHTNK